MSFMGLKRLGSEEKMFVIKGEWEDYIFLTEGLEAKAKERTMLALKYSIKKANFYKYFGFALSALSVCSIVLPALGTFCSYISARAGAPAWMGIFVPIVTSLTTVVTGLIALFKCNERKNAYRTSSEALKSELMSYYNRIGSYKDLTDNDADKKVYEQIEKIITSGNSNISSLDNSRK